MRAGKHLLIAALLSAAIDAQESDAARIGRVEIGLVPAVIAAGQIGQKLSITDRMAYHGVSALSVAVIDDGRIVWARAYGGRQGSSCPSRPSCPSCRSCFVTE